MSDYERPTDAEALYAYHCGQVDGIREALRAVVGTRNGMNTLRWMLEVARALADEQKRLLEAEAQVPA